MIKNEKQYRITKAWIRKFEDSLFELKQLPESKTQPWLRAGQKESIELQLEDLRPLGDGARLVTVKRCDSNGIYSLLRHKIAARLGFQHNWVAELWPQNLVRVLRDDGCAWTFTRNPILNKINIGWLQPSDDDDAEALTAAEFAIAK